MEPEHLIPPSEDDSRLEALLRQPASPLPDHGFTARVLAALPPPRAPRSQARMLAAVAGGLAGLLVALLSLGPTPDLTPDVAMLGQALLALGTLCFDPTVMLAVGVAAGSMVLVLWRNSPLNTPASVRNWF